ncbi:MAG: CehA/McbA family metallohydrolase [Pirellulales bacterium]|nr:CehA/McbA family metallohydrolase [Pirellulales bacterium]
MGRPQTRLCAALLVAGGRAGLAHTAAEPPTIANVELQPLAAQVERLSEALELVGAPLSDEQRAALDEALNEGEPAKAVAAVERVLDPLCIAQVEINPESRVKAAAGSAEPELVEHGWRAFLVKVHNEAGVTAPLRAVSPNAKEPYDDWNDSPEPPQTVTPRDVRDRWLDLSLYDSQPLAAKLSGLPLEYRIVELYSRDRGQREAKLSFDVGQGTQDLGFRNEVNILFRCEPSAEVKLAVRDVDGQPTTGQFVFRDERGRVYPARSRRLAPDFFFHDQIYRADGETIRLPAGSYRVSYSRGPEYLALERRMDVPPVAGAGDGPHVEQFQLQRWINLAERGWYSGDHHVHAAGCAHYSSPTRGVEPQDMIRHIRGEDLNVGCVLTWGPCWYHQKQFFDGRVSKFSTPRHLMRYDVEVSGFPSSHAGHLTLLRLSEDDYPGTERIDQWPTWDLPILRWAKSQGGVTGFAHSGWGLEVPATKLPTFDLPPFDGIGANEYIVDVTHDAVDFISAVDTPAVWELNIWYHTLNCGYTTRISGETDFPCIYGERVGLGRAYVKLPQGEELAFDAWVDGVRDGRSYVSEGLAHLFDFKANELGVGEPGDRGRPSVLAVAKGDAVHISVNAAVLLTPPSAKGGDKGGIGPEQAPGNTAEASLPSRGLSELSSPGDRSEDLRSRPLHEKPYWHAERARIGDTRAVPIELIVNGEAVEQRSIEGDGRIGEVKFNYVPERSSWIAVRVFPAAHTNPIFVEVNGAPIRASRRSAQWCLACVDRCWKSKQAAIAADERDEARAAYEHARGAYRQIEQQSYDDGELSGGAGGD